MHHANECASFNDISERFGIYFVYQFVIGIERIGHREPNLQSTKFFFADVSCTFYVPDDFC